MKPRIYHYGRRDNVASCESAKVTLRVNLLVVVAVIASILMTIPKSVRGSAEGDMALDAEAGNNHINRKPR